MKSSVQKPGTSADVRAQVATTQSTLFPFSSPNADDALSIRSVESEYLSNSSASPQSNDSTPLVNTQANAVKQHSRVNNQKERDYNVHISPNTKMITTANSSKIMKVNKNLHVITDFSQPQLRPGEIRFHQVAKRQPEKGWSRARSVVSQKGTTVLSSPLVYNDSSHMIPHLRKLIDSKRDASKNAEDERKQASRSVAQRSVGSPMRSSVVFGLSVPEHEAKFHTNGDTLQSSVTLVTPLTPKIVVTPAEDSTDRRYIYENSRVKGYETQNSTPSSDYTEYAAQVSPERSHIDQSLPPTTHRVAKDLNRVERSFSSHSQQQTSPESCETARPKSQGWWNLMLSPILSRAGTLKSMKARNETVPPVPLVPTDTEKLMHMQTPATAISPETPRRLGLADVRKSTWSQWTGLEADINQNDHDTGELMNSDPVVPRDFVGRSQTPNIYIAMNQRERGEGLAAEYYHACAVEQLTSITYFECINHSCAEGLPVLCSIYNTTSRNLDSTNQKDVDNSVRNFDRSLSKGLTSRPLIQAASDFPNMAIRPKDDQSTNDGITSKHKANSESQIAGEVDMDEIVSPNIRQANVATFSKAKAVNSREPSPTPRSLGSTLGGKQLTIEPTTYVSQHPPVLSPGPISPTANRSIAPDGAMPMAPLQSQPAENTVPLIAPVPQYNHTLVPPYQTHPTIVYYQHGQAAPYQYMPPASMPPQQYYPAPVMFPPQVSDQVNQVAPDMVAMTRVGDESTRDTTVHETIMRESVNVSGAHWTRSSTPDYQKPDNREKTTKKRIKILGIPCCIGRSKAEKPKNRRFTLLITVVLLIVIALCILFAILFTRGNGNATPIDSQWLNLSGYPPMVTGISTIARPNLVASQNGCAQPSTMWSCSMPREDQASISPNEPNQPNFRFQIRFRNGTVPANMTIALGKRAGDSADELFVPNPTPPGQSDQVFLGNTTDNVTKPFDGEVTPFFITFLNTSPLAASLSDKKLSARQASSSDPLNSIPPPSIGPDGRAAPASLLPTTPFPISQPVKLYNRGLRDEHYGFYIYYDRSIFLSGINLRNDSSTNNGLSTPDSDKNGGSTSQAANVRCTWSQTRFIVKIFTNPSFPASLLPGPPASNTTVRQPNNSTDSATNFNRPGSFPFPTTILLDRHGGDVNKKLVYCYGMNQGNIVTTQKSFAAEIRRFGGVLINPSPKLIDSGNSTFDSNLGGIDGGTGGCGCTWQNWA